MKIKRSIIALLAILQPCHALAWNAVGHRLIAQIAYNHMTPHARQMFDQYNHAMDKIYPPQSFTNAAVWLDTLRFQDVNWFAAMHYVDIPFSLDGSPLPPLQEVNALWAISKATSSLSNSYAKDFDKGTSLRVLLHVVGDIHQPLHAATCISAQRQQGDRGGNLLKLNGTKIAKNLHSYWDKGGGSLVLKGAKQRQIVKRALEIENHWPCAGVKLETSPQQWAEESHVLAVNIAYKSLPANKIPDEKYQRTVQKIAEQQIARAGCRLSTLLNKIDEKVQFKNNS